MLHVTEHRLIWYTVSTVSILASLVAFSVWGLRQGIEFTGGTLMAVSFTERPSIAQAQEAIQSSGIELGTVVIQPVGDHGMQFRLKPLTEEEHQAIFSALKNGYPEVQEDHFDAIGPVVGEELRQKSVRGLIVVLLAILIYVAYAFRKVSAPVQSWKYGVVTIFTAFHDVIIPIGVFSVLGHFRGVEIGTSFIAAILTILGYSITDTIVVMDRVRENLQKRSGAFQDIVEESVHQTFLRSFNTSVTTLLTLFAIYFFGGASLHEFTLALIIGISVGTYSSIFIASPALVTWDRFAQRSK